MQARLWGRDWCAIQVGSQAFNLRSPALVALSPVDIGNSDRYIEKELRPELPEAPCAPAGIALSLRYQPGFDHVYYYFSSKFMPDHVAWHAERLRRG
jgi:S-formylglutathione hydrolase FrmB